MPLSFVLNLYSYNLMSEYWRQKLSLFFQLPADYCLNLKNTPHYWSVLQKIGSELFENFQSCVTKINLVDQNNFSNIIEIFKNLKIELCISLKIWIFNVIRAKFGLCIAYCIKIYSTIVRNLKWNFFSHFYQFSFL